MVDMQLACRLIKASNLAYAISKAGEGLTPSPQVQDDLRATKLDPDKLRIYQSPKDDGIDAFLCGETSAHETILAFRGTLPPELTSGDEFFRIAADWLNDAEIQLVEGTRLPGRIHHGFLDSLDNLWPGVENVIPELSARLAAGSPFYVTGHSKGGALAALAGCRLAQFNCVPTAVFTYAAPRAGDRDFADGFNKACHSAWRFEYKDDIVPHLPAATRMWSDIAQVIEKRFSSEVSVLQSGSKSAPAFAQLVSHFDQLATRDLLPYASAGTLQFIDWSNQIQLDSYELAIERNVHLGKMVAEFRFANIVRDHFSTGGYMTFPCQGEGNLTSEHLEGGV